MPTCLVFRFPSLHLPIRLTKLPTPLAEKIPCQPFHSDDDETPLAEKYPGEHAWPWEHRGAHDDQWLDEDIPTPFDSWFGGNKKKQHSN